MENNIYLVTGAAGFLGSNVVRQLVEEGKKVRAFVLPNDKSVKYISDKVELVYGDLCNIEDLEDFFKVDDDLNIIVLHIASIVTVNPDYNQKVMDVNVGGTKNIIDLCFKYNVKKLVYCSSTGAIPETKGKIKECYNFDDLDDKHVRGCYSKSKAIATKLVLEAAKDGLNACVVHPSGILGPDDYALGETTKTLIKIINGEMPMGINGTFNLCDVRDLARGIILAIDNGKKGECYILGNDEVSFKNFTKLVVEESGCKKIKFFLPIWMANLIAKHLEKKSKKKNEKPLMTTFSVYNLARNNDFDSSKAKNELGYNTRPYTETIRDEIKWLKANNLINA